MKHLLLLSAIALSVVPSASAEPLVTAEFAPETFGNSFGGFGGSGVTSYRGQTFQALVSGPILTIQLYVLRNEEHDVPYVVSVFSADPEGRPEGDAIVSNTFPASMVPVSPVSDKTVFSFGGTALLTAGETYVITIGPETPAATNNSTLGGLGSTLATYEWPSLYSGGTTWTPSTITDWSFRVTVDGTTPIETASWGEVKLAF